MYAIFTSPFFIFLVTVLILIDNATLNGFLADGFHELQSQQSITVERSKKKIEFEGHIIIFFSYGHFGTYTSITWIVQFSADETTPPQHRFAHFSKKGYVYLRNSYTRVPTYKYECSYFTKAQGMSSKSYLWAGQFRCQS